MTDNKRRIMGCPTWRSWDVPVGDLVIYSGQDLQTRKVKCQVLLDRYNFCRLLTDAISEDEILKEL